MYHAAEEDTVTDASCMDQVKEMHDKSYYSKGINSTLKTRITLDLTNDNEGDSIISQEKVDKFGRSLEKSVPFDFEEDNKSTPDKSYPDVSELQDDIKSKDNRINDLEKLITERDMDINKLKKKLDDSKLRADRKEDTINKLLLETESLRKTNTSIEESIRDYELQIKQLTREKESSKKLVESLQIKDSDKENKPIDLLKQNLELKDNEIAHLTQQHKSERSKLKSQLDHLQSDYSKLKISYEELKSTNIANIEEIEKLKDSETSKIMELSVKFEYDSKKQQDEYEKQIELLNDRMSAKENVIAELRQMNKTSNLHSQDFELEVTKVSDKVRQEYIAAIETLQTNLMNLKTKYQAEVLGRKNDNIAYRDEMKNLKRQINILDQEKSIGNQIEASEYKSQLLDSKSENLKLKDENECLQDALATIKAAWAQSEMDKEDMKHKLSNKKEQIAMFRYVV